MHYVYIIESLAVRDHFYIGYTEDLRERIRKHQADVSSHSAKFRPWKLKLLRASSEIRPEGPWELSPGFSLGGCVFGA
jgi:predicted GIY-YIG superfamily endonuclease